MTPSPIPTVFVVDDDSDARDSMLQLAQAHGVKAEGFASAEAFLAARQPGMRGCVVADMRMGGVSGLDLHEQLKAAGATLPVIIITGFADISLAVKALRAGAFTFLEKPCPAQELWTQISEALDFDRTQEARAMREEEIKARLKTLTPDEMDVLYKLLDGLPNKQIAADLDIGLRTVELRRATILKKMHADSLAQLVRMAISAGVSGSEEGESPSPVSGAP